MNILLIGDNQRLDEMRKRLAHKENFVIDISDEAEGEDFDQYEVIMDLNFDDHPENLQHYAPLKNKITILSSVKLQLAEAVYMNNNKLKCQLFGINALPTFIDREIWEVSVFHKPQEESLKTVLEKMGVDYKIVQDRVGMVTPRILFMIINEAAFSLQEGTATKEDIDMAMKYGTNYPLGPFEWADKIGITDVFETLAAIYEDTKDERYKVCPLLKTMYLRDQKFYKKSPSEVSG